MNRVDNMVGGQADVKLVSNAMANATRRKIMAMLVEKAIEHRGDSKAVGPSMLDYHLQMLQQAGLIEMKGWNCSPNRFRKELHGNQGRETRRGQKRPRWHKAPGDCRDPPALALHCRQHQVQDNRPSLRLPWAELSSSLSPYFPGPGTRRRLGR